MGSARAQFDRRVLRRTVPLGRRAATAAKLVAARPTREGPDALSMEPLKFMFPSLLLLGGRRPPPAPAGAASPAAAALRGRRRGDIVSFRALGQRATCRTSLGMVAPPRDRLAPIGLRPPAALASRQPRVCTNGCVCCLFVCAAVAERLHEYGIVCFPIDLRAGICMGAASARRHFVWPFSFLRSQRQPFPAMGRPARRLAATSQCPVGARARAKRPARGCLL